MQPTTPEMRLAPHSIALADHVDIEFAYHDLEAGYRSATPRVLAEACRSGPQGMIALVVTLGAAHAMFA